jgi:hypothetical protein
MSHQIAPQHPAVVMRSNYVQLRALFSAALVAVLGLAVAVVLLANSQSTSTSAAPSAPVIVSVPAPQASTASQAGIRFDGGPEEGTRGAHSAVVTVAPGTRFDGGPEEGTRGTGH